MVTGVVRPGVVPIYGPTGRDGASAYLLAKNAGFTGTEAEWLSSLQGPAGPAGPQGSAGITVSTTPPVSPVLGALWLQLP